MVTVPPAVSQNFPPPEQPQVTCGSAIVPVGSLVVATFPVVTSKVNSVLEWTAAIVQVPFSAESERLVHQEKVQPPVAPRMILPPGCRLTGALVSIVATLPVTE